MHAHMAQMQEKINRQKEEMKTNALNPLVTGDINARDQFARKKAFEPVAD